MNFKSYNWLATTALAITCLSGASSAYAASEAGDAFIDALKGGKVIFDARYRYENVDDAGFSEKANASTLRTRLGYETGKFYDFSGLLEFSNTAVIGGENFNDTLNGKTSHAIVPDPEGTAINRAFLQYSGLQDTTVTVGRQTLTLDNERFVTNGNFRQKQKTFDQAHFVSSVIPHLTLNYAYMWKTHDNLSSDQGSGNYDTDNHLINLSTDIIPHVRVAGYSYLLDFDDVAANSLDTYGVHFDGEYALNDTFSLLYQGDWATQSEAADNPVDVDLSFYFVEPGVRFNGFTVKGGYLNFEGDGVSGFQTPLGDAHPYSGWADVFAATPANGLEEYYAKVGYTYEMQQAPIDSVTLAAEYHTFEAENTSTDYGDEWDAGIYANIKEHYTVGLEYANFSADSGSGFNDVDKLWLTLGVKF